MQEEECGGRSGFVCNSSRSVPGLSALRVLFFRHMPLIDSGIRGVQIIAQEEQREDYKLCYLYFTTMGDVSLGGSSYPMCAVGDDLQVP